MPQARFEGPSRSPAWGLVAGGPLEAAGRGRRSDAPMPQARFEAAGAAAVA